jgi:hypothetical protein
MTTSQIPLFSKPLPVPVYQQTTTDNYFCCSFHRGRGRHHRTVAQSHPFRRFRLSYGAFVRQHIGSIRKCRIHTITFVVATSLALYGTCVKYHRYSLLVDKVLIYVRLRLLLLLRTRSYNVAIRSITKTFLFGVTTNVFYKCMIL